MLVYHYRLFMDTGIESAHVCMQVYLIFMFLFPDMKNMVEWEEILTHSKLEMYGRITNVGQHCGW